MSIRTVMPRQPDYLLDATPLDGIVSIERHLSTARIANVVADFDEAAEAVGTNCESWVGASNPMIPLLDPSVARTQGWFRLLEELDPEHIVRQSPGPATLPAVPRPTLGYPTPLIVVLDALLNGKASRRITVPLLENDDPWRLAYVGCLVSLPEYISPSVSARAFLRGDLRYDDLLTIARVSVDGSATDLLDRVSTRGAEDVYPVPLTLSGVSAKYPRNGRPLITPVVPSDQPPGTRFGDLVVVVYDGDRADDLCLLWNLRASSGWPYGLPLAVPASCDVAGVIRGWWARGAGRHAQHFGRDGVLALTSASVSIDSLAMLASELGPMWMAVPPDEVLHGWPLSGRASTELVQFEQGRAFVRDWDEVDARQLTQNSREQRLDVRVTFRPSRAALPPSPSLHDTSAMTNSWRRGGWDIRAGDPGDLSEVRWPTGWSVVEAVARDRGLRVRPSQPGRAAVALIRRLGSSRSLAPLDHPAVRALVYRLGERSGITYFRRKIGEISRDLREASPEMAARADIVEGHLEAISASAFDTERHSMSLSTLVQSGLGSTEEAKDWVRWAEEGGLLIRGAEMKCSLCGHRQWFNLPELAPPLVCHGCGRNDSFAVPLGAIDFRYRASETLLRVVEADALGHVLALRWLESFFGHELRDDPAGLYGIHPGVEVLEPNGTVIGEVDLFLVFSDGAIALGEYKRSGQGLNDAELAKLFRVADAFEASWTFVATHSPAETCPSIWQDCRQNLPDRPHLAIVGEHFQGMPIRFPGQDPFVLPPPTDEEPAAMSPGSLAQWLMRRDRSDDELKSGWAYSDGRFDDL